MFLTPRRRYYTRNVDPSGPSCTRVTAHSAQRKKGPNKWSKNEEEKFLEIWIVHQPKNYAADEWRGVYRPLHQVVFFCEN